MEKNGKNGKKWKNISKNQMGNSQSECIEEINLPDYYETKQKFEDYYVWEEGEYENECRKVRISEKVKSIYPIRNYGPFYNCSYITHILIPNTVTSIGYGSFEGCSSLRNITIPNSVTSIGKKCF